MAWVAERKPLSFPMRENTATRKTVTLDQPPVMHARRYGCAVISYAILLQLYVCVSMSLGHRRECDVADGVPRKKARGRVGPQER
jgi:hypothetical protein